MTLGRRLLATALAAALLVALLLLSSLGVVRLPPKKPTVIENVQLYVPPQPPPAPDPLKPNERGGSAGTLQVRIPRRDVELGLMKLDTSAASAVRVPSGYGLGGGFGTGLGTGIGNDTGNGEYGVQAVFAANQLDAMPMVLSAPLWSFGERMRRNNISQLRVVFHIVVDEEGRTHPVRIVDASSVDFEKELMDYAARTVFTPPLHQGKPVKAQYLWPVLFDVARLHRLR